VCNLAARLCAEAKDGQIPLAQPVAVAVEETTPLEEVGELTLKGLTQPVAAYNVPLVTSQPALRVIEGARKRFDCGRWRLPPGRSPNDGKGE
jgi:adenylate cyclase